MSWQIKAKVPQSGDDEEIRTPDGQQIMVGAAEDQILLYQIAFNNWSIKTKTAQPGWALKIKVES
jgi:hypothetical protein